MEQEISFDFGPHGEFAYLYSQCYELTTNECVPSRPSPRGPGRAEAGGCHKGSWWDFLMQRI